MNQQELSPQQALEILAQAAALYKGTLEEHNQLQNAVVTVRQALEATQKDVDPS